MDIILTILREIVPASFQLSHIKCVESVIKSILITLSVNLMSVARVMADGCQAESSMRRIQRLLAMKLFSCTVIGRALFRLIPNIPNKVILTMDRTTWELGSRVYNILAVGICFDGISLPIYFTTYDKDGATSFDEHIEFMEHVLDIVPVERIKCLVADREFGNGNFIKWLIIRGIPFCLRLRGNFYIRKSGEEHTQKLSTILSSLPKGGSVVLSNTYIVKKNNKVRIYAMRRVDRNGDDSLLILATPVESDFTDYIYRLRWQIEVSFKALKTAGFNMEDTHLPLNGHFQNMLKLTLIAFACAFYDGLVRSVVKGTPIMKSNGRHRFSIFSLGLAIVVADLVGHARNVNNKSENTP